jgi:hypothetical protein
MRGSQFVCWLAVAVFTVLISGPMAYGYSDEAVKDAQAVLDNTKQRLATGEVTPTDVALAQFYLYDMQFNARQISRLAYCKSAMPTLQTIAAGFEEEMRVGQRSLQELIDVKSRLYKFKAFCQKS